MSTPTVTGLLGGVTAIILSTSVVLIILLILVGVPILYWIFRALTGRLGR